MGEDLVKFLNGSYEICAITRKNYHMYRTQKFDILINANGNSRRFWANEHPPEDFEMSTLSVMKSLFDFQYKKYVYISTPDVYENPTNPTTTSEDSPADIQKLSPYGLHKRLSEELVKCYAQNFLILRSAALLGNRLKKGVAFDILRGNELFVTPNSKIQSITTFAVANIIKTLLENGISGEIFNVGGKGTVTPEDIGLLAGKQLRIREDASNQQYEMNTNKIRAVDNSLKTSEEYIKVFIETQCLV